MGKRHIGASAPTIEIMNTYKKIKALLSEGRTAGEQRGRAHLQRYTHERDPRRQARALGAAPHEKPDTGEGSKEDVRSARMRLSVLRDREKTATGIQLAQIKRYISILQDRETGGGTVRSKSAENQSTEINMNGYERIYEILSEQEGTKRKKEYGSKKGEIKQNFDRIGKRARLRNREAGSMLTRPNQRRLTKIKTKVGKLFK